MRQLRRILLIVGAATLLGAVLGAPVTAAGGRILFVQGRPGTSVDICVGGKEVASGLEYGAHRARFVAAGSTRLRFTKAAPGACTGGQLAARRFEVGPGSDTTIVLTRDAPKLVVYPQTPSPARGPSVGTFVLRHAADTGRAGFRFTTDETIPWYPEPAVDAPFRKGDWGIGTAVAGLRMFWWAHRPPEQTVIAGTVELVVEGATRHELILVGTVLGNLRLLRIDSPD
jgi:hypothetical protein